MKPEFAYAIVIVWGKGDEEIVYSSIRGSKKRCIDNAKEAFYGGDKNWPYIKRQGFRCQKIKISAVRP